jgi:hypothetical protein
MAITKYSLTTSVTVISAAGESGICWMKEDQSDNVGQAEVYVYHTGGGAPSAATVYGNGKRLYKPLSNNDTLTISADDGSDIYYACCKNAGDQADIIVDVI